MANPNDRRTILSLFDFTGNWSLPYRQAGYEVIQVDSKQGRDVMDVRPWDFPLGVWGILAAPPCTHFSSSGARWWPAKDADGRTESHVQLLKHVLWLIQELDPMWWVIENPVGRLNKFFPQLGKPFYFDPYWYGDPYTKKTGLWGDFNSPTRDAFSSWAVEPTEGSKLWRTLGGACERTKTLRSTTPMGFARAFYQCNP